MGNKLILPRSLRVPYLKLVHNQHMGRQKILTFTRYTAWLQSLEQDLEDFIATCNAMKNKSPASHYKSWQRTFSHMERMHVDYGHWKGYYFLCMNSLSNLIDTWHLKSTGSENACTSLQFFFILYCYPKPLVLDNDPLCSDQIS